MLGGGYIGCEMGQMFRRFGSGVTIVHDGEHILSREDPDVVAPLEGVFRREGIELRLRSTVVGVGKDGDGIVLTQSDGTWLRGSHLLVAIGRRPNTDDLGCEAGGVHLDRRGYIVADEHYATSAPGVYAVGDVLGGPQFTHTSWDDHRLLFALLMEPSAARRARTARIIPYVVFTNPQLAAVGLNERQARARNVPFEIATMPFGDVARALGLLNSKSRPAMNRSSFFSRQRASRRHRMSGLRKHLPYWFQACTHAAVRRRSMSLQVSRRSLG